MSSVAISEMVGVIIDALTIGVELRVLHEAIDFANWALSQTAFYISDDEVILLTRFLEYVNV